MQQPSISVTHHTAFDWRARLRAAGIHLTLSALVALVAGTLVFLVWYPYPLARDLAVIPRELASVVLAASGHDAAHASYLPLVARKAVAWTVLLDAQTAQVPGFVPLDSF